MQAGGGGGLVTHQAPEPSGGVVAGVGLPQPRHAVHHRPHAAEHLSIHTDPWETRARRPKFTRTAAHASASTVDPLRSDGSVVLIASPLPLFFFGI